ncbi:MAG: SGNH/GDSL hydrolase family protein [Verrucomicrobiota bacterium]
MKKNISPIINHRFKTFCRFLFLSPYAFVIYTLIYFVPKVSAADFFIHDGDRVVFLGDSITEQRLYTNFIEAYALTRHPQWKLAFRNAGWAGDTAFFRSRCHPDGGRLVGVEEAAQQPMIDKVIRRSLDRDVLALKPTVVTIDLGMNDISVRPDTDAYNAYVRCITKMVEVFQENGVRTALLTPQPVENKRPDPDKDEKNLAMRKFADGLKAIAVKSGIPYVDQLDPYLQILLRERVGNPDQFIGGGQDGVHPGPTGHTIMAWSILKGLGATPLVSRAEIDAKSKIVVAADACNIENLKVSDCVVSFDRLDGALPLPIHPNAEPALKLAPVLEDLDRYEIKVTNLPPGNYQLSIDGEPVATMLAEEWAKGRNLATTAGPITKQGQEILKAIGDKNDLYFKRWRNVQLTPIPDWAQSPELESRRAAEMARLDQKIAESEAKIDKLRQPQRHHFEFKIMVPLKQ